MNNVISFPEKVTDAPRRRREARAKTLFIHIRNTTLIAHLAAPQHVEAATGLVGKNR